MAPWDIPAYIEFMRSAQALPAWLPPDLAPKPVALPSHSKKRTPRVIVIGAGIAGLAAAYELQQLSFEVVVVEGRDRIGGRIWSNGSLGPSGAVDLGASWIHGINDNPITELCHQAGLHLFNTGESVTMFDSDGTAVDKDLDDRMLAEHNRLLETARKWGEELARLEAAAERRQVRDTVLAKVRSERLRREAAQDAELLKAQQASAARRAQQIAQLQQIARATALQAQLGVGPAAAMPNADGVVPVMPVDYALVGLLFDDQGEAFQVGRGIFTHLAISDEFSMNLSPSLVRDSQIRYSII